jgi:hypothetical protein
LDFESVLAQRDLGIFLGILRFFVRFENKTIARVVYESYGGKIGDTCLVVQRWYEKYVDVLGDWL